MPSGRLADGLDSAEFLIDTNITYTSAGQGQFWPQASFDGTNYFVAWCDNRSVLGYNIYGARVNQAGDVLDKQGIEVSFGKFFVQPELAFGDSNYFVIWPSGDTIRGARVTPGGEVLDSSSIELVLNGVRATITSGAGNFLLVWTNTADNRLLGSRVSESGQVLDSGGFLLPSSVAPGAVRATFDGSNYLVTWSDSRSTGAHSIHGVRVSPDGHVLDTAGIRIGAATSFFNNPVAASGGANSLVVWEDSVVGAGSIISGARVSSTGQVLDPVSIRLSSFAGIVDHPAVAFDGTEYVVTWREWHDDPCLYGTRVSVTGVVLDSAEFPVSTAASGTRGPVMVTGHAGALAVWQTSSGDGDIRGTPINSTGHARDTLGFLVSTWSYGEWLPAAAFNGTNYLVAWREDLSLKTEYNVKAARVSQAGTVLDPVGFEVSGLSAGQHVPAVASDGAGYLIAWDNYSSVYGTDVHAARVSAAGRLLDSPAIAIDTGFNDQSCPAVAFDGTNYLVVWQEFHTGTGFDIRGSRISPAGVVLDPRPLRISAAPGHQMNPVVAFDGTNYLVVWQDQRSGITFEIYGARVSPDGQVLDTAGIAISSLGDGTSLPSVAFDGTNYLVAWQVYWDQKRDSKPLVRNYSLRVARVSPAGQVIDPLGVPIEPLAAECQYAPGLAFDGTNYLIVWQDCPTGPPDIFGARVSTEGALLDTFPVERLDNAQVCPRLAHGAGSAMLLVYQGWTGTVGGKAYNLDHIWGRMGPFTGIEERPSLSANRLPLGATIIKGVLRLPPASGVERRASSVLLDVSGRKVLRLHPGANDVSRLGAGVYFVAEYVVGSRQRTGMRKVVITR